MTEDEMLENPKAALEMLIADLTKFLEVTDHGDSSWPKITREELNAADELFERILFLKWGRDCDNDKPIKLRMYDRREAYLPWDYPLMQVPHEATPAQEQRIHLDNIRRASSAMRCYSEALDRAHRGIEELRISDFVNANAVDVWYVRWQAEPALKESTYKYEQPMTLYRTHEEAEAAFKGKPPTGCIKAIEGKRMVAKPSRDAGLKRGDKPFHEAIKVLNVS